MNAALNFLWVLGIEYVQNLPCILGVVMAWAGFKKGWARWKWLLALLAGNYGCAVLISTIDWIKLLKTTLTPTSTGVADTLRMGTIFSVASGLLFIFFALTPNLKKSFGADAVFGLIIGILIAVTETLGHFPPFLVLMHALGFSAAAASLVTLVRRSADAASNKALLGRVVLITLLLSVLIAIFGYAPHLRAG